VFDDFQTTGLGQKIARALLAFDAWINSSLYESGQQARQRYDAFAAFMDRFHVSGWRKAGVELACETLTLGLAGAVLMLALAVPAFQETSDEDWLKKQDLAVTFQDRYGEEVGRRGIKHDDSLPLEQVPDFLIQAVLATEDRRFFEHYGIDPVGTLRAFTVNARSSGVVQGGSTITQQLAKNLFLSSERTLERKIKEAFLSVWLETHYTKDEILKLYFDRAYMGGGNFGVAAAAEFYFGKKVTDITLAEAAMLAGLFKAPTKYAPHVDIAAARARANVVLSRMVDSGFLTEGQVTGARRLPAVPVDRSSEVNSPNYFLDWAFEETKKIVEASDSTASSFVVRTTIDPVLQTYAEDAITSVVREQGAQYNVEQAAMVVTEPTGPIRAMVGGMDYGKSQFNRAIVPNRQPGSSFKPFVYANSFEENADYTPATSYSGATRCIGDWCPRNYSGNSVGRMSLISAFAQSINTVPVNLSIDSGRQPIADLAHEMGIQNDFPVTRSLALGAASVSVLDMTSAYAVFANHGYKTTAYGITRITTLRGESIFEHDTTAPPERILSDRTVGYLNEMMRAVVTNGTGRRAAIEGVPAVGKTGTTSSYRDAWFCGFTGNYVAAVWFGNDDYRATKNLTGGLLPTIAWQKFMAYAHTNIEIKPVFGVDFAPAPFVIASADEDPAAQALVERPPTLKPAAALKLLDVADRLGATLRAARPPVDQATLAVRPLNPSASESL